MPVAKELRRLLRAMNSYYTNRIEGQHTRPAELEQTGRIAAAQNLTGELDFHRGELAFQSLNDEVAAAKGGLQKAGVNALGFALDQIEHGLDHPLGRENLTVVGNTLFGFDEVHIYRKYGSSPCPISASSYQFYDQSAT